MQVDVRDLGSIPGSGRYPEGGHGDPLQYSCLENPTGRGTQWAIVHRVTKSLTQLENPPTSARDPREAVQPLGWEDALEEEMATRASVLA